MEDIKRLIEYINIETKHLSTEKIQDVLLTAKKCKVSPENAAEHWNYLADILWTHIETGLEKLMISCYVQLVFLSNSIIRQTKVYINKMQEIIRKEIILKSKDSKESPNAHQVMSLMYGMFQSSF